MMRINLKIFALQMGVICFVCVFIIGLASAQVEKLKKLVEIISTVYLGYSSSLKGSFLGGIWGFVDGYISGILIGFIINLFIK
ncbi:MAG: hypothetical protein HQL27_02600 [Candidatus Omnitrophica bacterium]|nr:hypothetical protein [Candidatus Omnitrophota bacterium]